MNRNRWLAVIAVALVLSAGLTYLIFRIVQKRLQPPEETTKIVVAAKELAQYQRITKEDVKLADWPKSMPIAGAFHDVAAVIDRGVVVPIYPNDPITDVKLAPREGGAGLASGIPDGMRAVSVKVDSVIGVAGFVLPGTRVDVLITGTPPKKNGVVSRIFLENVQVATANQSVQPDANGKPQNSSVVTLFVTPEQAEQLVLAGQDRIQLALRNPLDQEEIDPEAAEREPLYVPEKKVKSEKTPVKQSVKPEPQKVVRQKPKPEPKPEPTVTSVELITGSSKKTLEFQEKAQ